MTRFLGVVFPIAFCVVATSAAADLSKGPVGVGLGDPQALRDRVASGDAEAMTALAAMHEHGQQVPRDLGKAIALYCKAAERGSARAHYSIGWMIMNGRGFERNDAEGLHWLDKAAAAGHPQATRLRGMFSGDAAERSSACHSRYALEEEGPLRPLRAPQQVRSLVEEIAPRYGLDPSLVLALIKVESAFKANAVSPKDARGLMQLLPSTAAMYGITELFDPRQNVLAGVKHLQDLLVVFKGDVTLALAAYNAGSGAVRRYGGVPPFAETQAYVKRIRRYYRERTHPVDLRADQIAAVRSRFNLPAD